MFDKFGEFDSCEELNRAAAAQLKEGDDQALVALALENGIDEEDVKDYIDGEVQELATPLMAALILSKSLISPIIKFSLSFLY